MTDTITKSRRSWNMSRIRTKNTKPEQAVRSLLHRAGYRFTVNGPLNHSLPGKPDLVFPQYRIVLYVNGCFWHRHQGCKYAYSPKSRIEFWEAKFRRNVERDKEVVRSIREAGWLQFIVWECQLKQDQVRIVDLFRDFLAERVNQKLSERKTSQHGLQR